MNSRPTAAAAAALVIAAAAAGVVATEPARMAHAQERPPVPASPAPSPFDAKSGDSAHAAAAKLWAAAVDARRNALFEFARKAARRVVETDPEHRDARALLGFVRRDTGWTEDPALAAKTPATNFPEKPPSPEQAALVERKWMRETWKPALSSAASVWTLLGTECAKKGDVEGARRAHERALELDPESAKSREGLGFYRLSGVWMTADQVRKVQDASRGETVEADSPADKALGVRLNKVRTAHFRLESRLPPDRLKEIAIWLESAYAVMLVEVGRDPTEAIFPSEIRMVVCTTDADWNAWVNTFVLKDREFARRLEGWWGENWHYGMRPPADGSDETRRDHLVHRAVHAANAFALGIRWPHWADEGLAHLITIRVQGMTRTWCVAPSTSDYAKLDRGGANAGWIDEAEWKVVAKAAAQARDDVPLRTLLTQPGNELGFGGVLKSWSFLEFLRTDDPAAFRALVPKFRTPKGAVEAVEARFGKGLEAVDEDWRRYVLRAY